MAELWIHQHANDGVSAGFWGWTIDAVKTWDPFYSALNAYSQEYHCAKQGGSVAKCAKYAAAAVGYDVLGFSILSPAAATEQTARVVIGAMDDLLAEGALQPGERTLLSQLKGDLGSREANWARNERVLLNELISGQSIRDATVYADGQLRLEGSGRFITLERNLLRAEGWTYDSKTTLWSPG